MARSVDTIRVIRTAREIKDIGKIAIYGTGKRGQSLLREIRSKFRQIHVSCFFCSYTSGMLLDVPVHPPELIPRHAEEFALVVIASTFYREIAEALMERGFQNFIAYDPCVKTLGDLYDQVYPADPPVAVEAVRIDVANQQVGIALSRAGAGEAALSYALDEEAGRETSGDILLDFTRLFPEGEFHTLNVAACAPDGGGVSEHFAYLRYRAGGPHPAFDHPLPTNISFWATDLPLQPVVRPADWGTYSPGERERDFAEREWGAAAAAPASGFARGQHVAQRILAVCLPENGVPGSELRTLSPQEQYAMVKAGRSKLWCENYATILCWALNALGLPARKVFLMNVGEIAPDAVFSTGPGHQAVEYYAADLKSWILVDPTYGVLCARLGEHAYLNAMEFAWNIQRRRDLLELLVYDPDTDSVRAVRFREHPGRDDLGSYYSINQHFEFSLPKPGGK